MIVEADPFVATQNKPVLEDEVDIFADSRKFVIPENAPVLQPLMKMAKVDFAVNEEGTVMVLFDQELPEPVHWVENDMDVDKLTFVTWNGKIFDLGMNVPKIFKRYMKNSHAITLIYMDKGEYPAMISRVPMVIRNIGV